MTQNPNPPPQDPNVPQSPHEGAPQYQGGQNPGGQNGAPQFQGGAPDAYGKPGPVGQPPKKVRTGAMLVYLGCAVSLIASILSVVTSDQGAGVGSLGFTVVIFALGALMARQTTQGKNGARIASLVFACLAALGIILNVLSMIALPTLAKQTGVEVDSSVYLWSTVSLLGSILYIAGVIMFWLKESNAWFRGQNVANRPMAH